MIKKSELLKEKRKKFNLTQKELAEQSGVNIYTIENIEQGKRTGSINTWNKIEKFFEDYERKKA